MIKVICVGKIKEEYLKEGIIDYYQRISKYHKIELIEVADSNKKEEGENFKKNSKERLCYYSRYRRKRNKFFRISSKNGKSIYY